MAGGVTDEELERIPRLNWDCDPTRLELTPAEGFLLSRIDGQTSWRLLREIGGIAPEDVDACLRRWLDDGTLEKTRTTATPGSRAARSPSSAKSDRPPVRSRRARGADGDRSERRESASAQTAKPAPAAAKPAPPAPRDLSTPRTPLDEALLDEALDLDLDTQRRILAFESWLDLPYHELLDVGPDADARAVKRSYFKLSKEFHPDRYFRRNIGDYAGRLDRIFKKVLEAYELMSDPATRSEVQRSMECAPPPTEAATPAAPLTPIERLRQRMPFRIPPEVLAERRHKASEFFEAAEVAQTRGLYSEAASSIRLAVAFDPFNDEYKKRLGDIQAKAAEARVAELLARDDFEPAEQKHALRLCEEAMLYRPHDPALNDKAALLAIELDELESAREYATRAVEHSPDVGVHHRTMGKVFRALGDKGHAVHHFERAVELDPGDKEASELLSSLRRRPRRGAADGGL